LCILACFVASVVPTSSGYAHSEQTLRADSDPATSDLRAAVAAFEGYNRALVERDYSKLREQFLYVPFVIVDDASRVITSVDDVVAGLRKTRESLEAVGYTTTTIDQPRVSVLAKDRLLLNCRLRHLRKDGSLLAERANFYVMMRVAGMWKIGGIIPQDPSFVER
jgi:hypothetical protein